MAGRTLLYTLNYDTTASQPIRKDGSAPPDVGFRQTIDRQVTLSGYTLLRTKVQEFITVLSPIHKTLFTRHGRFVAIFTLFLVAGAWADSKPASDAQVNDNISVLPLEDLRVFTNAYDHIRSSYIKENNRKTETGHARVRHSRHAGRT